MSVSKKKLKILNTIYQSCLYRQILFDCMKNTEGNIDKIILVKYKSIKLELTNNI